MIRPSPVRALLRTFAALAVSAGATAVAADRFAVAIPVDAPEAALAAIARTGASRVLVGAPGGLSGKDALARAAALRRLADAARAAGLGADLVLSGEPSLAAALGVDRVLAAPRAVTAETGLRRADALEIPYFDAPLVAERLRASGGDAVLVIADLARAAEPGSLVALNLALLGSLVADPALAPREFLDREIGIDGAADALFAARDDVRRVLDSWEPPPPLYADAGEALARRRATSGAAPDELRRRAAALESAAATLGDRSGPLARGLRRAAAAGHGAAAALALEAASGADLAAAFGDLRRAGTLLAAAGSPGELGGVVPRGLAALREASDRASFPPGSIFVPAESLDGPWRHQTNIGGYTGTAFRCSNRRGGATAEPLRGTIAIPAAGYYRVFARAYTGDGNDRSFSVSVGGHDFPPTHREPGGERYSWQSCGRTLLPAGSVALEVRDAGEGWESVDAILVAPDVDFEFSERADPFAVFASPLEREDVFRAIYARHTPRRPLSRFVDAAAFDAFRLDLRARVAGALGLDPLPERVPLDLRVAHRIERDGYSIERVWWQILPGVHASGWLYRPAGAPAAPRGSLPAILNPHGHFGGGAKHPVVQSRCIGFAKLGYVALSIDSTHVIDLASGLSPVGLMTWSNLRGLDLLESLPEVDRGRIGCTGASGGGQQTMYVMALDDRVRAALPAVMITYFDRILSLNEDAHCFCNHVPGIVAEADETEMVAAFAPRPAFFLCNTTDWTKSFPWDEFPDLARAWSLYGAEGRVRFVQHVKEHDYDREMRELAYGFFERELRGRKDLPRDAVEEPRFEVEDPRALEAVAAPPKGVVDPRGAVAWSRARAERERAALSDPERLVRLSRLLGHVESEGRSVRGPEPLEAGHFLGDGWRRALVETEPGVRLPLLLLPPRVPGAPVAILAHRDGKLGALVEMGNEIESAIGRGEGVVCADVRLRGELERDWTWNAVAWRRPEIGMAADDLLALARWARAEWPGHPVRAAARGDVSISLAAIFAAALGADGAFESVRVDALPASFAELPGPLVPGILAAAELPDVVRLAGARLASGSVR